MKGENMMGVLDPERARGRSLCVGVMSGTSVDGIDVAIVDIQGAPGGAVPLAVRLAHFGSVPFPEPVRAAVFRLFRPETSSSQDLCRMNVLLGELFADAVLRVCAQGGISPEDILLVSSHGQSVYHCPEPVDMFGHSVTGTLQIGEAAVIAERTGCPVIADFRVRDMAAGGQGAPLVPFVDALLFAGPDAARIAANIGGIANVTYVPTAGADETVFAFDTGPGNMIVDGLMRMATDGALSCDKDGAWARKGRVHEAYLQIWLDEPYLRMPPPKSTGRELFGEQCVAKWWADRLLFGMSTEDLVATATAYTVRTFCDAIRTFVLPGRAVDEILVGGGGAHNPVMMEGIARGLPGCRVLRQDVTGIPGDAKEAVAFAVLGYECFHGRPNNLPGATGARRPVVMGKWTWP